MVNVKRVLALSGPLAAAALVAVVALASAAAGPGQRAVPAPRPSTSYSYDVDRPAALFIGDSYSQGVGADAPLASFATILAENRGWIEQNWARGGTGYLAVPSQPEPACGQNRCPNYLQMLSVIPVAHPEYVVVSGGRNDVQTGVSLLGSGVEDFFTKLRARYPGARIIVTSPVWDSTTPPSRLAVLARLVQADAQRIGATYLDIGEPLQGHRDWIVADGIHPNDQGHAALARAVIEAMDRAGIGPG